MSIVHTNGTPAANVPLTRTVAGTNNLANIFACNTGTTTANISITLTPLAGSAKYTERSLPIPPVGDLGNTYRDTQIPLPLSSIVSVQSDSGSVDWTILTVEE